MQSFNKFLNLDVYDNILVYKVYGYKVYKFMYKYVYNLFEMELKFYK